MNVEQPLVKLPRATCPRSIAAISELAEKDYTPDVEIFRLIRNFLTTSQRLPSKYPRRLRLNSWMPDRCSGDISHILDN